MKALAAIAWENGWAHSCVFQGVVQSIEVRCSVEEAFGAEEVACACAFVEGEAEGADECVGGVVMFRGVVLKMAIAALGTEAVMTSYCFEQSGFSRAVFSSEENYSGMDLDFRERCDDRNGEGVDGPVFDSFAEKGDLFEHGELRQYSVFRGYLAVPGGAEVLGLDARFPG